MNPNERHPDPLTEAAEKAARTTVQLMQLIAMLYQAQQRRAVRKQRLQELRDKQRIREARQQEKAAHEAARLGWAPAYDKQWLGEADIVNTACVWSAAVPYATDDREAAGAMARCEDRLRHLHPVAMGAYDSYRAQGLDPVHAMRSAAPDFEKHPDPWVGDPAAPRKALGEHPDELRLITYPDGTGPTRMEFQAEQFRAAGHRVVERLQNTAANHGRPPLGPEELRTALDALTNLPESIIEDVVPIRRRVTLHPAPDNPVALAAEDFAVGIDEVLQAPTDTIPTTAPAPTPGITPKPGPRMRP